MNKTIKILIAVMVFIFIILPALGWFLFSQSSENTVVETEVSKVEVLADE